MVILQAWCDKMSLDTVMHPFTKCVIFLRSPSHGKDPHIHVQPAVTCNKCSLIANDVIATGKVNSFGWLRYSGFVRHKEPHLDAAGALADLLVFTLNLGTGHPAENRVPGHYMVILLYQKHIARVGHICTH